MGLYWQQLNSELATGFPAILGASQLMASILNWFWVALGLGAVIFFHELGHFAVAKWCGVFVERFSIGFGPILWGFKRGDTEYALSAIPFGGYVKMLGQDDMDPSQLSSEEIKQDQRSYSAKPVWQRMAIISAGVIMNVLTGMLFFAIAFHNGVRTLPARVGSVLVGKSAWTSGLKSGDLITEVNGKPVYEFSDIMYGVALSHGELTVKGVSADAESFEYRMVPDSTNMRRVIGVAPGKSLDVGTFSETGSGGLLGSAAEASGIRVKDHIVSVGGQPIKSYSELQQTLIARRSEELEFVVKRPDPQNQSTSELKLNVPPVRFRTLGISTDIERITAIQSGSPADQAGLRAKDKIIRVDGKDVGTNLNPVELPDYFQSRAGQIVEVEVKREGEGGAPAELTFRVTPLDRSGWFDFIDTQGAPPLSVPSIGVAFQVSSVVLNVEPGSPADGKIVANDRITKAVLFLPKNERPADATSFFESIAAWWRSLWNPAPPLEFDAFEDKPLELEASSTQPNIWATTYWAMQKARTRHVRLTIESAGETRTVELQPVDDQKSQYFFPDRGLLNVNETAIRKADSLGQAFAMSASHAKSRAAEIYLTLRSLIRRDLSFKLLGGPIKIAQVAHDVVSVGFTPMLLFLGFLSINLAVLNFLPIPVLDGGHLVFLIWEAVTRRRPSEKVLVAATYCGMAFVLGLMVLVCYLDVVSLFSGN